jgi:hypothetical protein
MSHFYESLHPEDLPRSHQGDPWPEADDRDVGDEPTETSDTALTDYLGGRQPVLEPIEALLPAHKEQSQ